MASLSLSTFIQPCNLQNIKSMNSKTTKNQNIATPSINIEEPGLCNEELPLSAKVNFIRRAKHDMLDFFGISIIVSMLKMAYEKGEDPKCLIDHLNDTC